MSMTAEQRKEWAYRLLDYIERRDRDSDLAWAVDTITALVDSIREEGITLQDYDLDALTHLKERAS